MTAAINDKMLVLFHYRDGLDEATLAAIATALDESPALAARYAALCATLARGEEALAVPEPDAGFEDRLWRRLAPQLPQPRPAESFGERLAAAWHDWWRPAVRPLAFAAVLAAVFGAGLMLGGRDGQPGIVTPETAHVQGDDGSQRVLAAYLAHHLESTGRLLQVAQDEGEDADARALARELSANNRLYAAAAERAGRPQLARFLREIEPVLLELATAEQADETDAVRQEIRDRDLPFKVRAAAEIARRPAPPLPGASTPL